MNHKVLAVAVVVGVVAIAGAYTFGVKQGAEKQGAEVAAVGPAASHPPVADQGEAREGRVGVDPTEKFTHFRVGNKNVKKLFLEDDKVWVATSGGLVRYNTQSDEFKLFDIKDGLLSNGMFYVGRVQGKITVGTYGGGMSILDDKANTWEHYNIPEGLGDAFIYDVLETKSGDLWIATWSGVNRIRGGNLKDASKWELHTVESTGGGLPNDWVYALAEGKNGEVWLATEGGMARFENDKWENWTHARGVGAPYAKVKDAIEFKSDPSKQSVHHKMQKEEMGLQDVDQAYNPNYIISLVVGDDGTVWAGTWGGGLAYYNGKEWNNLTTVEGLPGNHIFMLHRDPQNRIWIGTNNGLAVRDGDKFRIMKTEDGLFNNAVFSMATRANGDMWIGSFGGVAHIRPTVN